MMTNVVMEWRETLDGETVDSGGLCMGIDERLPHPWDDEKVENFFWVDDAKIVELKDGAAGSEWGDYGINSPEHRADWIVLPDLPEQFYD